MRTRRRWTNTSESSSNRSHRPSLILRAMGSGVSELKKQKAIWDSFGVTKFYEDQREEQRRLMQELRKARAKKAVQKRVLTKIRKKPK